jgi:hypothetical protein
MATSSCGAGNARVERSSIACYFAEARSTQNGLARIHAKHLINIHDLDGVC